MWKKWFFGLIACFAFLCIPVRAQPEVSSLSAILYLPETGQVLYEKDADTCRPMASTTKLMTALLGAEELDLNAEITVLKEAVLVEGSSLGLRAGDRITVQDLLTGMLLESGNDAANVVALAVDGSFEAFAQRMNQRASALGMKNSLFVTPSGLDAKGHGASARDMALLGAAVLEHPVLASICATKTTSISFGNPPISHTVSNHNRLLTQMDDCIGLKTGYTTIAGRCLVSAVMREDITLVAVSLNGYDYWNDHQKMYDYGFAQITRLSLPEITLPTLAVSGGVTENVALCFEPPIAPIVSSNDTHTVTTILELPPFVLAPVTAGDVLGYVRYIDGEQELCTAPLYAADTIEAKPVASAWTWYWRWFCALLAAWG